MRALQEAREAAKREAGALRREVEGVLARHRERVAAWEADAARDEAALQQRASALEARTPCCYAALRRPLTISCNF